ncbi:MAG: polymerase sigma-70 factor, subfamily [Nocardioidaceae bacterium]|nr:polymerase sigma-70 factor, subfamily [Nocardioidaceae bacterium]
MSGQEFMLETYDTSYRRLIVQLLAACGDQAEDAVQEAFVKAMGQAARFAHLDNPEAWLRTVALNDRRNRWRHTNVFRKIMPKVPGAVATLGAGTPAHLHETCCFDRCLAARSTYAIPRMATVGAVFIGTARVGAHHISLPTGVRYVPLTPSP